ncbi:MAG: amidohydrolase [Bryobacteraceae bacterium]|nr:amidohydrolase [Bryobacteraceae bacterium]
MIVDFHCHFSHSFFRYREYEMTVESLLAEMDRNAVGRAVISPAGEFAAVRNREGNNQVADAVRSAPDRFIGFAAVNPWTRADGVAELRRARDELGLTGLVIHPMLQGFEANDPLAFPLVEEGIRLGMLVYVTGGAPLLAVPYKIADLAGRYPEGRFIMGHAGWDFHFDVLYCLEACPNLWAETSKTELANLESIARTRGADRLLFGSDYPFSTYESEIAKVRLTPGVTEADAERILGRNALELLESRNDR